MNRPLTIILLVAFASPAIADAPAAAAFSAGMTAYTKGDFATAIAAFEAAFRIDPRAEVAFTLAQAHRNQYFTDKDVTHLHRALGLYRHYLAESPEGRRAAHARLHLETIETVLASLPAAPAPIADKPQATQLLLTADAPGARAAIDGGSFAPVPRIVDVTAGPHRVRLEAPGYDPSELDALAVAERLVVVPATLRAQPARLVVRTDDSAQIQVDGRAVASSSDQPAGAHRITIIARGKQPVVRDVELAAGSTQTIDVGLVPTPRRRAARWTLYGATGLGGASLIAGGVAWLAQREATSIPAPPARQPGDIDDYNDAIDRRNTWRTVSIGLATTAGIAALTGAALWYFDLPRPAEQTPTLTPLVGPESIGAGVVGRF